VTTFDRVALMAITAVAALLRLPGIDARGQFDADQGHDMLTLVAFTRDGVVPLLGPKTSVGDFHHGAFYYFLLAPAAAISNGDPLVVTAFIALLGIGAVALTWWLGRAIGGSVGGAFAGILMANSPAAIEESTFIWNPNPIGFFAALALAAAWKGHTGGRALWWAVAVAAAGAVVQLHVLGIVFFLAILLFAMVELRRSSSVGLGILAGLGIVFLLFVPLIVHELHSDFAESRLILDYLFPPPLPPGIDVFRDPGPSPLVTIPIALLRIVGWPLMGLVTNLPAIAAILLAVVIGLMVWGLRAFSGTGAIGYRWLVALLVWSTIALALAAPSLQTVVSGLPNDHYHAFLDPVVAILVAVPAADLWYRARGAWDATHRPAAGLAFAGVWIGMLAILAVGVWRRPPAVDPNGGWPAARLAGERIVAATNGAPIALFGTPDIKLPDGIGFPIVYAGGRLDPAPDLAAGTAVIVVACDRLFGLEFGLCSGPAEENLIGDLLFEHPDALRPILVTRFDASPRTSISIYRPGDQ
jgi:hypothetical protein